MARRFPYNHRAWPVVRRQVLNRDGGKCQIRLDGCTDIATDCDHIVAVSDGGAPFALHNLRAACHRCNAAVANKKRAARATLPSAKAW
jgi:5-methylcytosine-specific restriction endonuclease McrA